jgi:hypothetical protein
LRFSRRRWWTTRHEDVEGGVVAKRRKAIRRRSIRLHVFVASGDVDYRGVQICRCGSVWDASVHRVREISEDEREIDARKLGERHA